MPNYEVANPAVIIGLGGTGKWVLTYVKKNLLDTYGGHIPDTIRLLSFDTTQEKVSRAGQQQEEDARVGNVQLDRTEFTYLGGNIRQVCLDIRDKHAYPYIGSWLQASTYLETTDPDAFDIGKGAGQKRPFGRMSIFFDLMSQVQAQLANRIRQAITDVIGANQRESAIEIYIVASLSGGTGAGMVIDVAHLARWFASKSIRTGFAVRGFLALQNTFRSVLTVNQVEANTAAAMRELDRFMLVFDQQYPIVYNPSDPNLSTVYGGQTGKLFDNCYLLDAAREKLPLDNLKPQYGVYPSIADCITMLLDASTGDVYAQHYKNVNTRIAEVQSRINQPIYSSLGTFSLILPVEDIITTLKYRFAIDLLTKYLLRVEQQRDEHNQEQTVLVYEGDAAQAALDFLRTPRSSSGVDSTQFTLNTPTVMLRNINAVDYQREIAEMTSAELLTWLLPPESDPAVSKIARNVREILQIQLIDQVQPSDKEGDDYVSGSDRIAQQTARFKDKYLGRDVGGRRTAGEYRTALEQSVNLQKQRYRVLLREFIINTLNGGAPTNRDFQQERIGRLGYLQAILAHLSQAFDRVDTFFDLVRAYRAQTDELRLRREDAARAASEMKEDANRSSFLGMFHKGMHPAVKSQIRYLEREQDLIDYEVNELLIEHLRLTSEGLRQVTDEHKAGIDTWVNTLVMGFSGSFSDPGMYRRLLSGLESHTTHRKEKELIKVHEYVTDDAYEQSLYQTHADGRFEEAMARLVWAVEEDATGFKLTLPGLTMATPQHVMGQHATERNAQYLLDLATDYFVPLRKLTIADRISKSREPAGLALNLVDKCSPLVRFDRQQQGSEELYRYVCVNRGDQVGFFSEFERAFRQLGGAAKDNQVLPASNPYTCTILATADVISSYGLLPYMSATDSYNKHTGDARLLHIFPAEVNAVELEQKLPRIREARRKFAPRLTAMLENRQRVEQFVLSYLYGLITLEAAGGVNNRYVLNYKPRTAERKAIGRFELTLSMRALSLFTAMETFIFRCADISNDTIKIDFEQLDQELRHFEAEVMGATFSFDSRTRESKVEGGDASRLINLLEQRLDGEVERLRRDSIEEKERDLGSLMALIVNEIIEGLHARLRANNVTYDSTAEPLVQPKISVNVRAAPSAVPVALDAGRDDHRSNDQQAKLEAAWQAGILTDEEYQRKLDALKPVPSAQDERRAKLEAALQAGILTEEEYQRKLRELEPAPVQDERRAKLEAALQAGILTEEEYRRKVFEL